MVPTPSPPEEDAGLRRFLGVFRYSRRAVELVWSTSRLLAIVLALATLIAGLLPAAAAWVGKLIVDAVVAATETSGGDLGPALRFVAFEALIVATLAAASRVIVTCQSLLRAQLGQRVNEMILEKALTLDLRAFEDAEFYDKLTRARREASSRPLSLVTKTFGLLQNSLALTSYAVLLAGFSLWAVVLLLVAGLPAFLAETKFSGDAFRLFRWRSPETRKQMYLETVLAREDYAKEVKINRLGPLLLERYRAIFEELYAEDRKLTLRRSVWAFGTGLVGTAAFYGAYAWVAASTIRGTLTLGEMTMYLLLIRQGQASVGAILTAIGKMYEDNLYLSNLYEYLEQEREQPLGHATQGTKPGSGLVFDDVSFRYPGAQRNALANVSFELRPGVALALVGENGSGKTTLVKLLARLYQPTGGRIVLDGTNLRDWDETALQQRIGVIFQDFSRYQFLAGENLGAGDVRHFGDEERWRAAARKGLAAPFLEQLPDGYRTQLGKWFKDGQEISGGQWQKVALSRAFIREQADIFILDEPTAAMDAEAEAQVFEHVRNLTADRMTLLISHRFSTVRMADRILVLHDGRIVEDGSHDELMDASGRYAHLFELQAAGYR
ncbi:MAG: ABC transporter ATP-binding protein [Acidobacteriota bacterium]